MSRVGRKPVPVPAGVTVEISEDVVKVKGPKGELFTKVPAAISVAQGKGSLTVTPAKDNADLKAIHGTVRALVANMITGVTTGFTKVLEIVGTGYRAQSDGKKLVLFLGFAKPVEFVPPASIQISVESPTRIVVGGIDKVLVGQVASEIRAFRGPEPYKGKGIRYEGEYVRKKAGKAAVGAGT
ncbi:MAG: 50S ribosomal protein L6 [Candidatus Eisenbacteria bacterium]